MSGSTSAFSPRHFLRCSCSWPLSQPLPPHPSCKRWRLRVGPNCLVNAWIARQAGKSETNLAYQWSEPLKWHTRMGTVAGKGNDSEEKAVLPEISENGG